MIYDPSQANMNITGGKNDLTRDYSFDALGRLTTVSQHGSGGNSVHSISAALAYNLDDQLTDIRRYDSASPSSQTLKVHSRYGYDSAGRLSSITHADTEIAAGQTWDGSSQVRTGS